MRHSLSWDSHLKRDWAEQLRFFENPVPAPQVYETFITQFSWSAALVHHHDKKWFDERRVVTTCRDGLRVASRTGTRANPGHVQIRWRCCQMSYTAPRGPPCPPHKKDKDLRWVLDPKRMEGWLISWKDPVNFLYS